MKIIVENISNLTDARYFSAMQVDAVIFKCSENPHIEEVLALKELIDWIEGPEIIIPIWAQELAKQVFTTQKVHGYYEPTQDKITLNEDSFQIIDNLKSPNAQSVLRLNQESSFPAIENIQNISGIVISGGEEEKTGLKAYDWYDEFFDWYEKLS